MPQGYGPPPGGGPHGGPPGGPGGGGSQRMHEFHEAMRSYESRTRPAPIRGARGFVNPPTASSSELELNNWVKSYDRVVDRNEGKKFKKIRSFFSGTASFITEPWRNNRYTRIIRMTEDAYKQHRITREQYVTRILEANSEYYWFQYQAGYITEEDYNAKMDELEWSLSSSEKLSK